MKKKIILVFLVIFLGGCGSKNTVSEKVNPGSGEARQGDTVLEGTLTVQGDKGVLKTDTGVVSLESYTVKLSEYTGKKVKVKGQYSGDTLFVDEIR